MTSTDRPNLLDVFGAVADAQAVRCVGCGTPAWKAMPLEEAAKAAPYVCVDCTERGVCPCPGGTVCLDPDEHQRERARDEAARTDAAEVHHVYLKDGDRAGELAALLNERVPGNWVLHLAGDQEQLLVFCAPSSAGDPWDSPALLENAEDTRYEHIKAAYDGRLCVELNGVQNIGAVVANGAHCDGCPAA